ncbi:hypothetical protein BCR33DRAFT_857098 [Rhizoclosmatium globosum]|uniref:Uncharacterized protein n=1 Tax=Rhizoclosmatium globosum TaxID=329046 RepID=A0A1Y2B8Q8_9FUNG|nr:hypothetical protein BCR33DRAFT_857098 [Rhizoclosmatium globosum]|eukprot:ORY31134.1 hypothetical protein BCR33DRAFT_857098 [Rhizoclosmatium globosum]
MSPIDNHCTLLPASSLCGPEYAGLPVLTDSLINPLSQPITCIRRSPHAPPSMQCSLAVLEALQSMHCSASSIGQARDKAASRGRDRNWSSTDGRVTGVVPRLCASEVMEWKLECRDLLSEDVEGLVDALVHSVEGFEVDGCKTLSTVSRSHGSDTRTLVHQLTRRQDTSAPILIGVIVGIGCVAVLLLITIWIFRHKRPRQQNPIATTTTTTTTSHPQNTSSTPHHHLPTFEITPKTVPADWMKTLNHQNPLTQPASATIRKSEDESNKSIEFIVIPVRPSGSRESSPRGRDRRGSTPTTPKRDRSSSITSSMNVGGGGGSVSSGVGLVGNMGADGVGRVASPAPSSSGKSPLVSSTTLPAGRRVGTPLPPSGGSFTGKSEGGGSSLVSRGGGGSGVEGSGGVVGGRRRMEEVDLEE